MKLPIYKSNEELPLAMNAKDIAGYLNISLTCAYAVMRSSSFPAIRIGKRVLVTKTKFLEWLETADDVLI
ncbi:MAG: helix-turn-helix domain-containing protein [Clostridia bacterium]|nr:helix-turn-helix domain-containing protein [Clostridia bacterium]